MRYIYLEPSDRALLINIMRQMERLIAINNVQCIQFRPRIPSDQYYITIRDRDEDQDEACSSFVSLKEFFYLVILQSN